ncbi:hypothetical protein CcI49_11410 [Frankia sp. CcI49]|uniref:dienelactone hydrolase family protein n=1 Tax=Frankia sp. CcI49 TaxID=1745382 RepID=UPI0009754C6D|nr:dienelactone hydrolase family protein [Frankia sp. CcI49]ONH60434.1 hypothetical protein CcI49_11410 [Frankia sp. CcI49]
MIEDRLVVRTVDGSMSARIWHPDETGPFPVVLCYHAGPGLGENIYSVARRFAEEGYLAAVPDLYYRHGQEVAFNMAEVMKPDSAERAWFDSIIDATTPERMVADSVALVQALREGSAAAAGPFGCIGFCHTARTVIRAMAEHPDVFAVGSILHPSFVVTDSSDSPHLSVKDIKGEIYAGFGGVDVLAPLAEQEPMIAELEKLGSRATVEIHPAGNHGFLFPGTPVYDENGAAAAWKKTLEIFGRRLR